METKTRKKRVDWRIQELQSVVQYADANPDNTVTYATLLIRSQYICLPEDRWMSPNSLYDGCTKQNFLDKVAHVRGLPKSDPPVIVDIPKALPPPMATTRKSDSVVDRVLRALEPRLDQMSDQIAERVAAILLPQIEERINDMMFSNRVTRMSVLREERIYSSGPAPTQTQPAKRRIDVVGLLGEQTQVVKNFIAGWDVKVRFILADHIGKVDKLAPEVVLCSKFISHDAQDRARASGSKIHYANGAASSVVNMLETLCNRG